MNSCHLVSPFVVSPNCVLGGGWRGKREPSPAGPSINSA